MTTAAIIAVGSELLPGGRAETNSLFLAEWLGGHGIDVRFKFVVGDDVDDVGTVVTHAAERTRLVLMTGGLGPTVDDVTREAVAAVTGRPLRLRPRALKAITAGLRSVGRPVSAYQRRQALLPVGADLILNPVGTAPGFSMRWKRCRIVCLPGVSREARGMLSAVLAILRRDGLLGAAAATRTVQTFGLMEGDVDARLRGIVPVGGPVRLGLLASPLGVTVSLTSVRSAAVRRGTGGDAGRDAGRDAGGGGYTGRLGMGDAGALTPAPLPEGEGNTPGVVGGAVSGGAGAGGAGAGRSSAGSSGAGHARCSGASHAHRLDTRRSGVGRRGASRVSIDHVADAVVDALGHHVVSDDGQPMEVVVGRRLRERGFTIAVAESCTGGLIGHRLTSVAGSSAYMDRSVVCYSNDAKRDLLGVPASTLTRHGAVSAQTARAMAEGIRARSGADVGLSVTGVAGPGGGTPRKPVGLVYVGLAVPGRSLVTRFRFHGDRQVVTLRSSQGALDVLRRWLDGLPIDEA